MDKPTRKQLLRIKDIEDNLTNNVKFVGLTKKEASMFITKYKPQAEREKSIQRTRDYMDNEWYFEDQW